jgi:hypothetical protein
MHRTHKWRLRIIAPHSISTLYHGLCSDSSCGHFNYVYMHLMNRKFLASLYLPKHRLFVFYAEQLNHSLLKETYIGASRTKLHSLCQALLLQELLFLTMGLVAEFSFCVSRSKRTTSFIDSFHTALDYGSQNRDRRSQDILIPKGTKHQLSVDDKIPMVYFLTLILHFSSLCGPHQNDIIKNNINSI